MRVYRFGVKESVEPNRKMEEFADIDDNEFVEEFMDLSRLVTAGRMSEAQKVEVDEAMTLILTEGLLPALLDLHKIRESVGKDLPTMHRLQPYQDFSGKLWKSYKHFTQRAIKLMGFNIGFLFDNEKGFRKGLQTFREANPEVREGFEKSLENAREKWQNDLKAFRNERIEHQVGEASRFEKFYDVQYAEFLFETVWQTISDILLVFLEVNLPHGIRLAVQPRNDPGPRWPTRYQYDLPPFKHSK